MSDGWVTALMITSPSIFVGLSWLYERRRRDGGARS